MSKYYVVSGDILPDVLEQVMQARILLQSGKAKELVKLLKWLVFRGAHIINIRMPFFFHLMQNNRIVRQLFR